MDKEGFGIITFESTHHAINGEKIFKDKELEFKTIPTPREITLSCGLSIKFLIDDWKKVEELIENENLAIKGVYRYTKKEGAMLVERIM